MTLPHRAAPWSFPLAVALAVGACAQAPASKAVDAATDCAAIEQALANERQVAEAAEADAQGAWKAVVPFAVAARYASASSSRSAAQQRMQSLEQQAQTLGCERHGR